MLRQISLATAESTSKAKLSHDADGALWNIEGPPRHAPLVLGVYEDNQAFKSGVQNGHNDNSKRPSVVAAVEKRTPLAENHNNQHIMISYDWNHKEPVRKLNAELQKIGYRTWLDVEKMSKT